MPPIQPLRSFEFHQRIAATSGSALVIFTAPACGGCRQLRRVLAEAPEGLALFEVDAETESALVHEFGISHLPSLHLFCDGCYHAPIEAGNTVETLLRAIARALRAPAQEAP